MLKNCKWIWTHNEDSNDEYADFCIDFNLKDTKNVRFDISIDGNFEAYLNGKLCAFGACADYPFYKLGDSFMLDEFCQIGKNELKITVWHIGCPSSVYVHAAPGLIFGIYQNDDMIAYSSEKVCARQNINYQNGMCKIITGQMGPSYRYDNTIVNELPYLPSVVVEKTMEISHRGIDTLKILPRIPVTVDDNGERLLIDWGKEAVGHLDLDFESDDTQELKIVFGEHLLDDGTVPQIIGTRDFSIGYKAKVGENKFLGMMRRIAGRYLEIHYEKPLKVHYIGLRPVVYPLNYVDKEIEKPLHRQIYDTSAYTLECCMHEHYEDCPWREQALYSLDSRNQMLCGYTAFKEFRYPRYNIILLAKSLRNGLLRITSPTDTDLPIPFFSLTFIQQVYEYVKFSGDRTIIDEVSTALDTIIETFASKIDESGLIPALPKPAWNFYEWTAGNEGYHNPVTDVTRYDLCLNAMYLYVLPMYQELRHSSGVDTAKLAAGMKTYLFDHEKGLFKNTTTDGRFSVIGNALAVLAGVGGKEITDKIIAERNQITDLTLSMNGYFYDALLSIGDCYNEYIIRDIEEKYGYMLSQGATTFWETIDGWHAFGDAGSLCHGWSALPIHYLSLLGCAK